MGREQDMGLNVVNKFKIWHKYHSPTDKNTGGVLLPKTLYMLSPIDYATLGKKCQQMRTLFQGTHKVEWGTPHLRARGAFS